MSDRGALFLFSLGVIVACLAVAVWLAVTGQAAYIDGLFLLLSCLAVAFAFGLYVRYIIKSAMAGTPTAATEKSAAATKKPAPPVPAATEQLAGKTR